jgi:NAD(P)H-dependent flavin oxidoreductase YrpB (nitropropane dioxygenase family)
MKTRVSELLGIEHPLVLGGMAGSTSPELVAAVSNAGGLGVQGCTGRSAEQIAGIASEIRELTDRPFGVNLLLFLSNDALVEAALSVRPPVLSTAWGWPDFDLASVVARARDVGSRVMHMVSTVHEARRAAEAGVDLIVAQGTEGGGHVGLMGTIVLIPQVVRAVSPIPVIAAGGIADGAGVAAALLLGAEGVLLGTRLLATHEAPLPREYKEAICQSDGHDTLLTELPDVIAGNVWPGAYARVLRTAFVQEWLGREAEVRLHRAELSQRLQRARSEGDVANAALLIGQDAGLIDSIQPAGDVIQRMVAEAEALLTARPRDLLGGSSVTIS